MFIITKNHCDSLKVATDSLGLRKEGMNVQAVKKQ